MLPEAKELREKLFKCWYYLWDQSLLLLLVLSHQKAKVEQCGSCKVIANYETFIPLFTLDEFMCPNSTVYVYSHTHGN